MPFVHLPISVSTVAGWFCSLHAPLLYRILNEFTKNSKIIAVECTVESPACKLPGFYLQREVYFRSEMAASDRVLFKGGFSASR